MTCKNALINAHSLLDQNILENYQKSVYSFIESFDNTRRNEDIGMTIL